MNMNKEKQAKSFECQCKGENLEHGGVYMKETHLNMREKKHPNTYV